MEQTFDVRLWQDDKKHWLIQCPSIPGCVSQGRTETEALSKIEEAIKLAHKVGLTQGIPANFVMRSVTLIP